MSEPIPAAVDAEVATPRCLKGNRGRAIRKPPASAVRAADTRPHAEEPTGVHDIARLRAVAEAARRFLEPLWLQHTLYDEWSCIEPPLSRGTCRVSSEFLVEVMADLGHGGWSVHGGKLGYAKADDERWPHYWLSDGAYIIDVTADQFGGPGIVVGPPDRGRYLAGPADVGEPGALSPLAGEWHAAWRERAGVPVESGMSAAAMDGYLDHASPALALALRGRIGGELARVGKRVVLLVGGTEGVAYDATGMADLDRFAFLNGVAAHEVELLREPEASSLASRTAPGDVEDALRFALSHPALRNAVVQAFYAARETDDPGDARPEVP